MQLTVDGDVLDQPVTNELITQAFASMAGKGEFFIILAHDEMTYIQTSGSSEAGFVLEYQDGSIEKHYSCTDTQLSADRVIEALQRYFNNHGRWKSDFTWEQLDLGSPPAASLSKKTILSALAIVIAIVVGWFLASA